MAPDSWWFDGLWTTYGILMDAYDCLWMFKDWPSGAWEHLEWQHVWCSLAPQRYSRMSLVFLLDTTCLKCKNSLPNTGSRMSMKCRPQPMIRPAFPRIHHSPMKKLNLCYFGSPSRAGSWMTCKIQDSLAKFHQRICHTTRCDTVWYSTVWSYNI